MKKIIAILLASALLLSLTACGKKHNKDPLGLSESPLAAPVQTVEYDIPDTFKIGFICLNDEKSIDYTSLIDAIDTIKEAFGISDEQVVIKNNVPETEVCYQIATELARQGCDVIFANSSRYEDFIIKAAKKYPKVQFCQANGIKAHTQKLKNYHNAYASIYEGRYLSGVVAGMKLNEMLENGDITKKEAKLGYVGAYTCADVISGYTAFYIGAKSVCPSVTMDVRFTGSWYDVVAEQKAAEDLIDRKSVIVSQYTDSMGAPIACQVADVPNLPYGGSTYDSCPDTFLVASAINWAPYINYVIECVVTHTAIEDDWCGGIEEGSVILTGFNRDVIAQGTEKAVKQAIADLKSGKVKVFDTKNFKIKGETLNTYLADVDFDKDSKPDTQAISDGYFHECEYRSAPYFDLKIDGINFLNEEILENQ